MILSDLPGIGLHDFPSTYQNKNTPLGHNSIKQHVNQPMLPHPKGQTHLCGVVDILKGGITEHHGPKIRERTQPIEPALGVILLGALKKLNH